MPQYRVKARGFFEGRLYDPLGKRKTLHTDKPFKKGEMPSWLCEMPAETAAAKKKRLAAAKAAKAKAKSDNADIANASFLGAGESAPSSDPVVETL